MNKRLLLVFLLIIPISAWSDPSGGDTQLAEGIVRDFYINQNISDTDGRLYSSIVIKQEILNMVDGEENRVIAHLFMKDEDTYLVYLKNERNESICYLYRGSSQWVFRENLHNPMRVNMSQNVSGNANLGDLIGIDILRDFKLTGTGEEAGAYTLFYERSQSSYPYPSIVVGADKKTLDIEYIEYQGLGARSMRRVDLIDYRIVSDKHRIPTWRITNLVTDKNDYTEIRYMSIDDIDIPAAYFSPTGNALSHFLKWSDGVLN